MNCWFWNTILQLVCTFQRNWNTFITRDVINECVILFRKNIERFPFWCRLYTSYYGYWFCRLTLCMVTRCEIFFGCYRICLEWNRVFSLFLEIFATKFCDFMSLSHFLRHVRVTMRNLGHVATCMRIWSIPGHFA